MSVHHKSDAEIIATTHNTARFFTEHRQVATVLLLATFAWGLYGYHKMPKRKDPDIPVRVAMAQCNWPGATAEQVEQLVTRPMEQAATQNTTIKPHSPSSFGIRSMSFPGLAVVYIQLDDNVKDKQKEFSDINLKMNQVNLPRGAGPIQFNSNFGNTAALMLTVASPIATPTEIALRANPIRKAIEETRSHLAKNAPQPRVSVIYAFPLAVAAGPVRTNFENIAAIAQRNGTLKDLHFFDGPGYVGLDSSTPLTTKPSVSAASSSSETICRPRSSTLTRGSPPSFAIPPRQRPNWPRSPARNITIASSRLHESDPAYVARRAGNFHGHTLRCAYEQIYLDYSQQRLAQYGYDPSKLKNGPNAQNITLPGGTLEVGTKNIDIDPSGLFPDAQAHRQRHHRCFQFSNSPVYLRDLVDISRSYQSPPTFLNFMTWQDAERELGPQPCYHPGRQHAFGAADRVVRQTRHCSALDSAEDLPARRRGDGSHL